jgi:CRP-like cAMP-binding protein
MAQQLRDVLPLHVLDETDGQELFAHLRARRCAAGELVYERGDPAADTFVVHHGAVKLVLQDQQGRELLVGRHARGEFFGTLSLFKQTPRECTAVAMVPTTLLRIGRSGARRVLARNPVASSFLFERMAEKIERLEQQIEAIAFLDVRGRLARQLLELGSFGDVGLRQEEIAGAIGANVFTVNKTLAEFARRRLVRVARRRVFILDEARLRLEIRP